MAAIFVLAETGAGKSTSLFKNDELGIKGLNPEETFVICCAINTSKGLPFRGWKKHYQDFNPKEGTGNLLRTSSAATVLKGVTWAARQPNIKNIVIDDLQYIMADKYVSDMDGGFDVFKKIGADIKKIISAVQSSDKHFICLSHYEDVVDSSGKIVRQKAKTVGKMVDQYLTLEGNFDVVLYVKTEILKKPVDNRYVNKFFVTNADGEFNQAKSPFGMFREIYTLNDMGLVVEKIEEHENGE